MATDVRVVPMQPDDLAELVRLHALYLNYGEGIHAHFAAVLADPTSVAVKAVCQGRMVGLDIYTRGVALSGGHADLCGQILSVTGEAEVYTGDALLVVPAWRGKGVDRALHRASRRLLAAHGAVYVLYELWVHPDGRVPARRTLAQFERRIDFGLHRNFYVDFDHYGYFCPLCGAKCRCSARLYLCLV